MPTLLNINWTPEMTCHAKKLLKLLAENNLFKNLAITHMEQNELPCIASVSYVTNAVVHYQLSLYDLNLDSQKYWTFFNLFCGLIDDQSQSDDHYLNVSDTRTAKVINPFVSAKNKLYSHDLYGQTKVSQKI